jgi:hypothetical protein
MQAQLALLCLGAAMLIGAATRGYAAEVARPVSACPAGTKLTSDNFGQAFVNPSCTGCHATGRSLAIERETPTRTSTADTHATSPILAASDRRKLSQWLAFDAP